MGDVQRRRRGRGVGAGGAAFSEPSSADRFVIESASDGLIGLDGEGWIRSWNPGARRIFGYRSAEIVGSPVSRLLPPQNRRGMSRLLSRLRRHPWIEYSEASCRRKDDTAVDVAFTAVPERSVFRDGDGILLVVHDITSRRKLEQALLGSLRRSQSAAELASLGAWEWDMAEGGFVWSEELQRLLGLEASSERTSPREFLRRIPLEERGMVLEGLRGTLGSRRRLECRHGLRRKDGAILQVVTRARLVQGPGATRKWVGTCQASEAAPTRSPELLLRSAIRRVKVAQARALILARAALFLFEGFDPEPALVKTAKAVVPALADRLVVDLCCETQTCLRLVSMSPTGRRRPTLDPGWVARQRVSSFPGGAIGRVRDSGEYEHLPEVPVERMESVFPGSEALSLRPDVRSATFLLLPLHSREAAVGVLTLVQAESGRRFTSSDVRIAQRLAQLISLSLEHARLYAEVVRENERLQQQERELALLNRDLEDRVLRRTSQLTGALSDLETLAHGLAHDLRGPLRGIAGLAEILEEGKAESLGMSAGALTKRIREGCARMEALIADILVYGKVAHVDAVPQPVDLADLVERARRQVAESGDRGARIEVVAPLPKALGHPAMLLQAVVNLLENAIKFVVPGERASVRIAAESRGDRVRLLVEDEGIGIPPEHATRIFKAFERLHGQDAYPGSGLGLAIVRRSVERMGGTVGVEPRDGKGSRFWIELPLVPGQTP